MNALWPWLLLAGAGVWHGLNPANGWMFAVAAGARARDRAQVWRALPPIALGHAASVALVAYAVTQAMVLDPAHVRWLSGALLFGIAICRALRDEARHGSRHCPGTGASSPPRQGGDRRDALAVRSGIALWSFLMATAHGAGMMLVPALVPLCSSAGALRGIAAMDVLPQATMAVALHLVAMLATTGIVACGVCRRLQRCPRLLQGPMPRRLWTAALAVVGAWLLLS